MKLEEFQNSNKNKDFTLIARDCIGGVLYHQLGLKFLSPTINLFFTPEDFNYFCLYLKDYIDCDLKESIEADIDYPVGVLAPEDKKPIKVHFMHYESYSEAEAKWNERKKRINWDNIYVCSSFAYYKEIATFTPELVSMWNKIAYKKVLLVDKKYGFDDEFVIQQPKECLEYAWLLFSPDKNNEWRRTFNDFNFIKFLNEK